MWCLEVRSFVKAAYALYLCLLVAGPASGEEAFPFLLPDQVRAAYETERRDWLPTTQIVKNAFIAAEDKNFYDLPARSTITAGITRWYPHPASRQSLAISFAIARALEPNEILAWFVHGVFLGQGCFGVDGAAVAYFDKPSSELEIHEAALLAALTPAPARFHPIRAAAHTTERRNAVLREMADLGMIRDHQARSAMASPLSVRTPLGTCPPSGH